MLHPALRRSSVPLLFIIFASLACLAIGSPPALAQPAGPDKLVIGLPGDQETMDPHMHFQRSGILMNINMYDSLLHKSKKLEYEPSLATSWKALSPTTWEFKLRRGVKFHNGDPFTAADVKFSIERVLNPQQKSPQYGNIRSIKDIRTPDDYTVQLVTDRPSPLMLERLVFFPIVPKAYLQKVGDQAFANTAPVGTGAYKFVEWKRDRYLLLEAFDAHWRGKAPIRYLVYRPIPEVATQIAELKTGGVDLIRNLAPDFMPDIKAQPDLYVSTVPILRTHWVLLDMREAPFNNKLVRQAANYAVDKQGIVTKLMGGLGQQVATVVNPMAFGYDPNVPPYAYDPAKAKQLLAQAGYPNGVDNTIHVSVPENRPMAEAIAQMLTEVGIRTKLKIWSPGAAFSKVLATDGKAIPGYYSSWGYFSIFDADAILYPLYHTESGGWVGKFYTRIPGLDGMIEEARSTVDVEVRKRIYSRIQTLIREEAASLFLFHQYDMLGINKRIEYEARGDEWIWVYDAKLRKL